ncbi:MAG: IS200/IS605 family transposase [Bacteroidales bacterium]|nr:IS200/IS605 family transposase [Bacteroidales bacterium]
MSYIQSIYHIVFRTYRSEPTINEEHERELYAIIMKQSETLRAKLIRIGGMPDHIHLLISLPSDLAPAKYVQAVKSFTSKWLRESPSFPNWSGWGKEYAAISYSVHDKEMIVNYIKNQKEHHKKVGFAEEYRECLLDNGIAIKEEYFLKD